jgi:acetyl-CoA carboxylase biotin carboxyl carrier protein
MSNRDDQSTVVVHSPVVGTVYRAAEPGGTPLCEVGDHVEAETIVCVLEVMKLIVSVPAGVAGTVERLLFTNGSLVQEDQPLLVIRRNPAGSG